MEQWEYRTWNTAKGTRNLERTLNAFGEEGWELVGVVIEGEVVFKRRKQG